jgi:hypothetical protein
MILLFFPGKIIAFSYGFTGFECLLYIITVMCWFNYYFVFLVQLVWLLVNIFVSCAISVVTR